MHYVTVQGYPLPAPFGGDPALELTNTWSGWADPPRLDEPVDPQRDYLADPDRFAVWLGHVGLLEPVGATGLRARFAAAPREAAAVLTDVRRLRSAAYPLLLGPSGGSGEESGSGPESGSGAAASWSVVAELADAAAAASHLVRRGATVRREIADDARRPVHLVAGAVERLLTDPSRPPVRACPGPDCGWLFLDRTGRRKWCSMTSCGNRAKARAHEERRRSS